MAMCIICCESFSHLSWGGASEPCACGHCITKQDFWQADPETTHILADMKARWNPKSGEFEVGGSDEAPVERGNAELGHEQSRS